MNLNTEVRWSDIDPNLHVRHSAYYDYGAYSRLNQFLKIGLSPHYFKEHNFGPILFREECVFKKEIIFGDTITLKSFMLKARIDFSRWTTVTEIYKNNNVLSAVITVDGAFINGLTRKLYIPSNKEIEMMKEFTKHESFEYE